MTRKRITGRLVLLAALAAFAAVPVSAGTIALAEHTIYHTEWGTEADREICRVQYPQLSVAEEFKEEYPGLEKALNDFSVAYCDEMESAYEQDLAVAKEDEKRDPEDFMTHTNEHRLYIRRADDHAVSLLVKIWMYTGGVHGGTAYRSWNYDPATGEELAVTDVVKDTEAFSAAVLEKLAEKYPWSDWSEPRESLSPANADNWVWTVGYEGVALWFGNYELVSYAEGCQNVLIPFAGNEALFNDAYFDVPAIRGSELPANENIDIDLNGDGTTDHLQIDGTFSGYDWESINIRINDNVTLTLDDFRCYEYEAAVIRTDDVTALYVEGTTDNDYRSTYVFSLDRSSPVFLGTVVGSGRHLELNEDDSRAGTVSLTSPTDFVLDTNTSMLSTVSASRHYTVGRDGFPEALDSWYMYNYPLELTVKKEFTAIQVDGDGNELEECAVPEGSVLTLLRTDDETWSDVTLEDGRIVRLYIDSVSWPRTTAGESIDDLFDGIRFAG